MMALVVLALHMAGIGVPSPDGASGWRAEAPAATYDGETIFEYIDGHGEVYLAYGMRTCAARRYEGPPGESGIVLDVFDMGSPADAYGAFSHSREGAPADVGDEGSFGAGTLAFWKGSFFVSVTAERATERSRGAVLALGRAVADRIPPGGGPPPLVDRLPRGGLEPLSVVYLRHPIVLAAHLAIGSGLTLGVAPDAPAVLGRYQRGTAGSAWLAVVQGPSSLRAAAAREEFAEAFLVDGRLTRLSDGWYGVAALPGPAPASAFVVRATTQELATILLAEAAAGAHPQRSDPP